ncbi:MAG TPA: hypothetical protein VGZ31_02805 [Chthoniobacterales bacterium]|jgi:hypothetical protein|nr:hypothetical protein [Chthoniobacterales bacterium]
MKNGRKWQIALLSVFALGLGGYFAATRSLDHLVRDGTFLRLISRKTAVKLNADFCGYLPLAWRGMLIRSDGVLARGQPPHSLVELSATNLRAHCSLKNLWRRKWTITLLEASHLEAAFGPAAAGQLTRILPRQPELEPPIDTNSPLKLDIQETDIARTDVYWGATPESVGGLKEVHSRFFPKDHGLEIVGRRGTFHQTGWPDLEVAELHFDWAKPRLVVKSAFLSLGQPRNFSVTGGFELEEHGRMKLHVSSKQAPAEPFITGFWRGKFEGVIDSESDLEKHFESDAKVNANGQLNFSRTSVHDVPTLKQIAVVTRHPQFEKPKIDILRFRYRLNGDRLEVSNFEGEIRGLCRLEGEFSIEHGDIDGKFKVGAAPDVVDAIPGAREKVFTESHGDYLWTTLQLTGPAHHPHEDLSKRLVAAAQEHFAKGFLAPIFKPGKGVIELLQQIYK